MLGRNAWHTLPGELPPPAVTTTPTPPPTQEPPGFTVVGTGDVLLHERLWRKATTTSSLTAAIVGGCGGTFWPGDARNRRQGSGAVPADDQRPDGRSSSDAFSLPVGRSAYGLRRLFALPAERIISNAALAGWTAKSSPAVYSASSTPPLNRRDISDRPTSVRRTPSNSQSFESNTPTALTEYPGSG